MPIIKSAVKRAKQTIKRRERNVGIKRDIKDAVKTFLTKPSAKGLSAAQSEIDTAVKKGLIKKNTAARRKAQLSKIAKNAGVKLESPSAGQRKAGVKLETAKKTAAKAPVAKKPAAKKTAVKPAAAKKTVTKKPAAKKAAK